MPLFKKKPVVVEAVQWTGFNFSEIMNLAPKPEYVGWYADESLRLWNDLEGCWVRCPKTHWVIKGVKGEIYPCEVEAFEQTYEVVPE